MNPIAEENFRILRCRWPDLAERIASAPRPGQLHWLVDTPHVSLEVGGQRLWSAYDPEAEARLQAEAFPSGVSHAFVYGIGGGDLARALLQRPSLTRLDVVPLNLGLAKLLLTELDHRDWLRDPRTHMRDFHALDHLGRPFGVVPGCVMLAEPAAEPIRILITLELDNEFNLERRSWVEGDLKRRITDNIPLMEQDGDVASLFSSHEAGEGIVVLSGPTLKKRLAWLAQHRTRGPLLAVDGSLQPLLAAGIHPDVVVTADTNRDGVAPYFRGDLSGFDQVPLVYLPVTPREILTGWPGPRLTTYTNSPIYAAYRDTLAKATLFSSGSVAHMAIDLAVQMGLQRIYLVGADFGFPGDQIHANENAPVEYYRSLYSGLRTVNGWGEEIATLNNLFSYRHDLEHYIATHASVEFVNTCRDGARISGTVYLDSEP